MEMELRCRSTMTSYDQRATHDHTTIEMLSPFSEMQLQIDTISVRYELDNEYYSSIAIDIISRNRPFVFKVTY